MKKLLVKYERLIQEYQEYFGDVNSPTHLLKYSYIWNFAGYHLDDDETEIFEQLMEKVEQKVKILIEEKTKLLLK